MAQSFIRWPFQRRAPLTAQEQTQAQIDRKLRAIERQGTAGVRFGHGLAYLLVFTFSVGALVALAGDALRTFLTQAHNGTVDIPSAISFVVSFILVFAMDTAMVRAAETVRMLRQRSQPGIRLHAAVIATVCAVESATYLYMSYLYDHPGHQIAVWTVLTIRALTAPLMAVYLALGRQLPVSARDINTQVEVVTGRGVLMEMTRIADDAEATTERKVALYRAAAIMDATDRARLDAILDAERTTRIGSTAPSVTISERPLPPAGGPNGSGNGGSPSRLNNAGRRAAIERDMLTARAYDLDEDAPDGGWSARNDEADDFDMDWEERPSHPTRPRSRKSDSSAAKITQRQRDLFIDLPIGKSELPEDTAERRRVLRYLDKHPEAPIKQIMKYARVSDQTARRHRDAWRERNRRAGVDVAPVTEEMDAIPSAMLSAEA